MYERTSDRGRVFQIDSAIRFPKVADVVVIGHFDMTHRSRSGGPTRSKQNQNKAKSQPRRLHHPPSVQPPTTASPSITSTSSTRRYVSIPTDTEILQLCHHALRHTLESSDLGVSVQKVKSLLYEKKWLEVFMDVTLLESYAGRWVPSRALCFRELMGSLSSVIGLFEVSSSMGHTRDAEDESGNKDEDMSEGEDDGDKRGEEDENGDEDKGEDPSDVLLSSSNGPTHIISLGGGASSELLAVAALIKSSLDAFTSAPALPKPPPSPKGQLPSQATSNDSSLSSETLSKGKSPARYTWTGVDIGPWGPVVDKFAGAIRAEWDITPEILSVEYHQLDLLSSHSSSDSTNAISPHKPTSTSTSHSLDLPTILQGHPPNLITLFFTLTELLTQSRTSTISLLHFLTTHTNPGTQCLVVDSASDIAEFEMGKGGRKWPVWMILDAVMLDMTDQSTRDGDGERDKGEVGNCGAGGEGGEGGGKAWELVTKDDSRWYRLAPGVGSGWPVKLENTRYWMRLYRRRGSRQV